MNALKSPEDRKPREKRPAGVTVIAILEALGGIVCIVAGRIVMTILVTIMSGGEGAAGQVATGLGPLQGAFQVGLFGGILFTIGIAAFFIAYGLLEGSNWAWTLCLVFAIIGIALGIVSLPFLGIILLPIGIIPIIAYAAIAYYLTRPHVKQFFRKAASQ